MRLTLTLVAAAVGVGSLHTLAPDHWVPFAALARAERWSAKRTALVTAACGAGHVTVSVILGLLALGFGLELLQAFGRRLESLSGLLLIGFGTAYALWALRRTIAGRPHVHLGSGGHDHHVQDRFHGHRRMAWTLFLLFSADPCVAVIPLMFAATAAGWGSTLAVVAAYELATIATMIVLVVPARAAIVAVRAAWFDRWGDAIAGGLVAGVGLLVAALGI